MEDLLTAVKLDDLPAIVAQYSGPKDLSARVMIKTQICNLQNDPNCPVKIYSLSGDPIKGLVCVWDAAPGVQEISVFSKSEDKSAFIDALSKTKAINRNIVNVYCAMMPQIHPHVSEMLDDMKRDTMKDDTFIAYISKEKIEEFVVEDRPGIRVDVLGPEFADEINEVWPHRHPASLGYFKIKLTRGDGLGLIDESTGELIAWIFTSNRGDLHALQVKEKYKRQGYGQMLVKILSKKLAAKDIEVFGCIVVNNTVSQNMFQKLGFELLDVVRWISNIPKKN